MMPIQTVMASTSGLSALGVNGSAFLIELITFVLALLVLRKWAFGPIVKMLNQRRTVIEDGLKLGEKMRQEQTKMEERVEQALHKSRQQADQIIADAQTTAKQIVHDAESDAKNKAVQILEEAQRQTGLEIDRARRRLETEIMDLIAQTTTAILDETVDAKKDAALIQRSMPVKKGA